VFLLLPVIGTCIFYIFGVNVIIKKHRSQFLQSKAKFAETEDFTYTKSTLKSPESSIFNYCYYTQSNPVYENNKITIIDDNHDLYEEYINAIRSAKHSIHIETYIIKDGLFLFTIYNELIKKINDGVKIKFLYD
jgi:cardiolipin synthase